ncbi:MAG TPA: hypothetical protein VFE58_17310 [Tepidisphaeraceae bacterium]|jgi:hypothetical protein|nr:hypothetical protein [Tepidisphaeraceae bacterium]
MNDPHQGHPVATRPGIPAMPVQPVLHHNLEPIGLEDDELMAPAPTGKPPVVNKIQAFGTSIGSGPASHAWKRTPHTTGTGICRVKSFHGRLSDQGMEYIDNQINEWLDAHADVDVKAVTTNTNLFDGKMKELALIVNIWY